MADAARWAYCRALSKIPDRYENVLPDHAAVTRQFYRYHQKVPNFETPKTFNEKINWRKLYQRDKRFTAYADKIAVKPLIASLVGERYVIETLWTGADAAAIPFEDLTPPYVVKVNHSCGNHVFVRNAGDIDKESIICTMRAQLLFSHAHMLREWGYSQIVPQILGERMIELPDGTLPEDFKFFVYHGRVHFIQVDHDRQRDHRQNFHDRNWVPLPVRYVAPPREPRPAPQELGEMIQIAETIGREFDFVRVDLYATPMGVKFGELTFYPNAGMVGFDPPEWDLMFGECWHLPSQKRLRRSPLQKENIRN